MSIWSRIKETLNGEGIQSSQSRLVMSCDTLRWAFVDAEVGVTDGKVHDIGAIRWDGAVLHTARKNELVDFVKDADYICGHNIIHHDAIYLFEEWQARWKLVDTLYVSPLLFPERPYHRLLKDDKLLIDQMNNPVNDCEKAYDLLMDELAKWKLLTSSKRLMFSSLLHGVKEFEGFIEMAQLEDVESLHLTENVDVHVLSGLIRSQYKGKICEHADIEDIISRHPCEMAYALALIDTTDYRSVTPAWVLHNYPDVENVMRLLRHTKCKGGCGYCNRDLDVFRNLKYHFGYDRFRVYDGEPLQEDAVRAAVDGKSLLAIFPTGGGKSLTFQLPALMEARSVHGLTVIISPLQSLMKDQVDNLADRGITDAVTINGLLDPISRSLAIQRVKDGDASLLYIAPESLRSNTVERILLSRQVVRFVIDEAHCFSSWGQDFRVDYLYIGKFIGEYQRKKKSERPIPVSCFTATAKQKVVQDICDYFRRTLNLDLVIYASKAARTNLRYSVIHAETDEEKYMKLRSLVAESSCPVIVYVSRTSRTRQLAGKLTSDGFWALPFNGKMEPDEKIANQEAFMTDQVRIIVATSAFGMGVDKKDVGMVVHYDISESLENYVQEAGRAGRDPQLQARCYVLYSDGDLDKHFILLNQTKLSISEIQQVWRAVKTMTKQRCGVCCSALEIARMAGWDDSTDIETRVRTALAALEQAGYIERRNNVPHVYATGITVKNTDEARKRITDSRLFDKEETENAVRIIKSLISQKYIAKAQDPIAESRVDYLADILGLSKNDVVSVVERMRQEGILADSKDISAFLNDTGESKSKNVLERFSRLERYILEHISNEPLRTSCKQLNDNAQNDGIAAATEKDIRTLLYFLTVKGYIRKKEDAAHNIEVLWLAERKSALSRFEKRVEICRFTVSRLYGLAARNMEGTVQESEKGTQDRSVKFSIVELLKDLKTSGRELFGLMNDVCLTDVEEALLYLSKIGAVKLEGGFLVLYNAMDIRRLKDRKLNYKKEDYRMLDEFYKQKIQQIHIVGEYANLMVKDYSAALQFVQDYFNMDYRRFISNYFKGERLHEIERNITSGKYRQLFGQLSDRQMEIISDKDSRCIVVAAGPGSGKTRVLVHKLASLLLLEDVKHDQLLMLTFSRAAATEFKQRLMDLIGDAAHFVEIKTFHSYSFDLLGRIGNIEDAQQVVARAAKMIDDGEVEPNRIAKSVLVIDEAQDMSGDEYALIRAMMTANEGMRVIAVGDDDQNIFEFRGSDSRFMWQLLQDSGGRFVEMTDNYRSCQHVVDFANAFVQGVQWRMKKTPIQAVSRELGSVRVLHHSSKYMYEPLVDDLMAHYGHGTTCVLTQTNEEAVIMVALLRKRGLNSKLIQSMDGFRFWNLAVVRMFVKHLEAHATHGINDAVWEDAKQKTYSSYALSTSLPYLKRCIQLFEETNRKKYLTDFKEYVFESSVEDFCDVGSADVVVSTIHKSKGREYDNVYMLLTEPQHVTDDEMRRYYVGMTRAKKNLSVHANFSLFDGLPADSHHNDVQQYGLPCEVVLQLSHKDVNLGFFKSHKKQILSLRAGEMLRYEDNYLFTAENNSPVCQLSQKMQNELIGWSEKGYGVSSASIRFIVAWLPKDAPETEEEHAVLLVDLTLKK